ncbi:serine protease [Nonomuraea sp. K274]|uniref:Serine protease n=1 Tax=Nonomuraea cypriaca TaxID=1187855 RepID=A0A931F0S0_9ACTN|nr:CAP domain-containing protein [Nonomuraea cypriaca]MBF8189725.1 serine protease [Nonomuraea cypriaca]
MAGALPDATNGDFLLDALRSANACRARHHAPPLVMDALLVDYARSRAAARSSYGNPPPCRGGTGENLFWGAGDGMSAAGDAVTAWYDEVSAYDWEAPPGPGPSGHFSQLVWKNTTRMGAARVSGQGAERHETYIVFVFEPPGNVGGEFAGNVLPA